VFFEVLLNLLIRVDGIHCRRATGLRAGTQYVLYNLLGSTLFLFALARILCRNRPREHCGSGRCAWLHWTPGVAPGNSPFAASFCAASLCGVKAAILAAAFLAAKPAMPKPTAPVRAIAIMTKVGGYCIIRSTRLLPS